ncbi:short-chain dehydrogenase/reductase SDR [Cellulomonas sp. WB94]|uniref:SDR family oxidoreductase n=1 Tax=Cellulomonas sp. WB94 TaxID=2173174 RepID=UPI000D565DE9|nr:SDR family oxidoreductase [Cellulomonas sp. WB94]PVU81993.1 short-chain dehydrogenase/reductase SDR [Cellulomonas sp. WB94]
MTYQTADLTGKVAFITGGSSGIGSEVARSLSAQGVKLALFSRSGTAPELPDTLQLHGDVGNRADVDAAVQKTVDTYGHLDIVVANAGVGSYGQFVDVPEQHEDEMIRTNVLGTIYLYRAAVPHLQAAGGGDLITVASEAGRRGLPGEAVYSASKFAQVGLTRALDNELREDGIRATNICPGGVWTNFAIDDARGRTDGSDQLKGMMRPADIAELITFVLTRPRHLRILETALRPMTEASWG